MKKIYLVAVIALLVACVAVIVIPYLSADPAKWLAEADRWYDQGETQKAIAVLDRVLEKDPGLTSALLRRGIYRWSLKDAHAIQDFDRVVELNPSVPYYHQLRADYYSDLQEYGKAMEDYNRAIELLTDPMRKMRIRLEDAREYSQEQEVIFPEVLLARMKAAFYLGDLAVAAQDIEQAMTFQSLYYRHQTEMLLFRACILFLQGADRRLVCADLAQVVDVQDPVLLDRFEEMTGHRISAEELLR